MELAQIIKIARGDEPADTLLKNGRVINVFSGEILATDIAIVHSRIVGLGPYEARQTVDLAGRYVAPGLIDSHVLPLPIAGLMSDQPIERVRDQMDELLKAAHHLGSPLHNPFMAMSFLALPVIPSLKLTDHGLVDVDEFHLVSLFV